MKVILSELKQFLNDHAAITSTDKPIIASLIERIHHLYEQDPQFKLAFLGAAYRVISNCFTNIERLLNDETSSESALRDELFNLTWNLDTMIDYQLSPHPDEALLIQQLWYMNRMEECGYPITRIGMCYGFSYMALQAFLADDMDTFDKRLQRINTIPIEDFKCDEHKTPFSTLRIKQQHLISEGELKKAAEINANIVDILAFFDGVALHQQPEKFDDLFLPDPSSSSREILQQNAQKTLPITLSKTLDTPEKQPVGLKPWTGAYDKLELIEYLSLLQQHLGTTSFALQITSAGHAINLNYNHNTQQWLLIDPNILPGRLFSNLEYLADALLRGFQETKAQGLVMETNLYSTADQAAQINANYLAMKNTPEWEKLHALSKEKINAIYPMDNIELDKKISAGNNFNQCAFALRAKNYEWIEQAIPNMNDATKWTVLDYATQLKDPHFMQIALGGIRLTENEFITACHNENILLIQAALQTGYQPTNKVMRAACGSMKSIELISNMMDKADAPTEDVLIGALQNKYIDKTTLITHLIDTYHAPITENVLTSSYGDENTKKILVERNISLAIDLLQSDSKKAKKFAHDIEWFIDNLDEPLALRIRLALQNPTHTYKERLTQQKTDQQTENIDINTPNKLGSRPN